MFKTPPKTDLLALEELAAAVALGVVVVAAPDSLAEAQALL